MKLGIPAIFNRAKRTVTKTLVTAVVAVANTMIHVTRANAWRDSYNPLRGLTMARVVSLLEAGERGAYADVQWTFRFIEKRDATLRGGKRSLLAGVVEKPWKIATVPDEVLPEGFTAAHAKKQQKRLREAYDALDNLRDAIEHLGLAEFRGYAHLEKHYGDGGRNDGAIVHLEPVEQWYMCRDGLNGAWTYNENAASGLTRGREIDLENFIIREIDDPIDEIALIAFVRKALSQKDWDGYVESFGIPSIFIEMPAMVPDGDTEKYQAIAEQVVSDARGALPAGAKVHTVNAGEKGGAPFKEHLTEQNEQIALAITSGLLTMLAESGSGTLAGGAHTETLERVIRTLAKRISETFQRQFDKPILETDFPGQPVLAYFEICAEAEMETGDIVDDVAKLKGAGYEVDPSQISEKTGYNVTLAAKPVDPQDPADPEADPEKAKREAEEKQRAGALKNRRSGAATVAETMGVPEDWLSPLAGHLEAIIAKAEDQSVTDTDLLAFLDQAALEVPELFDRMDVDGLADALAGTLGGAALEGVRQSLKERKES